MRGLPRAVKSALEKARDSALMAVELYNKPALKFKSGGYITLMVIAWTSLFHAVFFKRKIKPFYREKDGWRFAKVDGDFKYWELQTSLREYFGLDSENPVRKNLEFFIPLRNKIEHRSMPELDSEIFGECQAMLLNLDEILEREFGSKYCLRESLSFALQMFPSSQSLVSAIEHNPANKPVVEFIQSYRSTISSDVFASGRYAFRAFLIQVANHEGRNSLAIQFVHYDRLTDTQKAELSKFVAMVKYKEVPGVNLDTIRPGDVVKRVQTALGEPKISRNGKTMDAFNLHAHTRCWKYFQVRPATGAADPFGTKVELCIYDKRHNDYGYTEQWVSMLIRELKDTARFEEVVGYKPSE